MESLEADRPHGIAAGSGRSAARTRARLPLIDAPNVPGHGTSLGAVSLGPSSSRTRPAARVVLFDPAQRVFLMHGSDPLDPSVAPWWEIPGGGIGHGETSAQAARRELLEETGFVDVDIGPCVWTQRIQYTFAGMHFDSDERIHVA